MSRQFISIIYNFYNKLEGQFIVTSKIKAYSQT